MRKKGELINTWEFDQFLQTNARKIEKAIMRMITKNDPHLKIKDGILYLPI